MYTDLITYYTVVNIQTFSTERIPATMIKTMKPITTIHICMTKKCLQMQIKPAPDMLHIFNAL